MEKYLKISILAAFLILLTGCDDLNVLNYETCKNSCHQKGYEAGECLTGEEALENDLSIGACVVGNSLNCRNQEVCQCYCRDFQGGYADA